MDEAQAEPDAFDVGAQPCRPALKSLEHRLSLLGREATTFVGDRAKPARAAIFQQRARHAAGDRGVLGAVLDSVADHVDDSPRHE